MPESVTMGTRDLYSIPYERLTLNVKPLQESAEHSEPCPLTSLQEPAFDPFPIFQDLTIADIPWRGAVHLTNSNLRWWDSCEPHSALHDGLDQLTFKKDLPEAPLTCKVAQDVEPSTRLDEEPGVLRAYENIQGTLESCTCDTTNHDNSCSVSGSAVKAWVMVSYKRAKPVARTKRKVQKVRGRNDVGGNMPVKGKTK